MAGEDFGVFGEWEEVALDAGEELLEAAAGEVASADGALEDDVAGEEGFGFGEVEGDAVWGVAGDVVDGDGFVAEEGGFAGGEEFVDLEGGDFWQAPAGGEGFEGEFGGVGG